jgi:hypothetical protein
MSTETDTKVIAEVRENFGKGYARRLRAGCLPATSSSSTALARRMSSETWWPGSDTCTGSVPWP